MAAQANGARLGNAYFNATVTLVRRAVAKAILLTT
jgi:hypothetical protein